MNKTNFTIAFTFLLLIFIITDLLHAKQLAKNEVSQLTQKLGQLQQTIIRNNQIIADNEKNKQSLEQQSLQNQEQINGQLKENYCANQLVPMPISGSLYNRAKNLRQSTNTSESTH
ncbi:MULTISPECIES: hypothetical protein [unclassified Gilliamella]|uniref:hypothetical protein n=1 Tax=unclassified Gilliamella TaxID=2685620 RepID=UPI000A34C288|nr:MULTISPECIES: hypothetical protein [unclassified Gilliamella]OTQ74087.1 hypothetical protein B6C99_05220 [Gilliamella sp. N-G2]OTQ78812.1 hypothetical protein B6D23_07515 [Gilliamella sp. N-W3]